MIALAGVSKTAILTLRARADEHARRDRHLVDPLAAEWIGRFEWPIELDGWFTPHVQSFLAFRADEIDRVARAYLAAHPAATVVELGCGLSSRHARVGASSWIDLDLPEVVAAREALGVGGPGHRHLAMSVLDRRWLDEVRGPDVLLIAEGLLYYLPRAEVEALFLELRRRLAGAVVAFDVVGTWDHDALLRNTTAAGAPIQWHVEPPFEAMLGALGLEPIPEWDHAAQLREAVRRYWPRFGTATYLAATLMSKLGPVAARRSGTLVGRLTPLPLARR